VRRIRNILSATIPGALLFLCFCLRFGGFFQQAFQKDPAAHLLVPVFVRWLTEFLRQVFFWQLTGIQLSKNLLNISLFILSAESLLHGIEPDIGNNSCPAFAHDSKLLYLLHFFSQRALLFICIASTFSNVLYSANNLAAVFSLLPRNARYIVNSVLPSILICR